MRDPGGNVVYANSLDYSCPASFRLSGTDPTGTYTATLTWDVGPYRSTPLTATTTFQVQERRHRGRTRSQLRTTGGATSSARVLEVTGERRKKGRARNRARPTFCWCPALYVSARSR